MAPEDSCRSFHNYVLLLFAASSWMETTPMAGKSWEPSHEAPNGKGGKQAPFTLIKTLETWVGWERNANN